MTNENVRHEDETGSEGDGSRVGGGASSRTVRDFGLRLEAGVRRQPAAAALRSRDRWRLAAQVRSRERPRDPRPRRERRVTLRCTKFIVV